MSKEEVIETIISVDFQTFKEEFPLDRKVSHLGIIEERSGDWVTFKVPKLR